MKPGAANRSGVVARIIVITAVCALLAACGSTGGKYYQDDGPPRFRKGPDPSRVPDAVPRHEPLARSGNAPYTALGQRFTPMRDAAGFRQVGYASWYGRKYHGNRTSSGEIYDMYAMTAAHPVLPLPTYVSVRNLGNGRQAVVKVNDRGPFLRNRVIDLSYMAARKLGIVETGTAKVEVTAVFPGDAPAPPPDRRLASVPGPAPAAEARPVARAAASAVSAIVPPAHASTAPVSPPSASPPSASPPSASYVLQAGSFASGGNAGRLVARLEQGGYGNVRVELVRVDGRDYHRVLIGPYQSRDSAELVQATIEDYLGAPVSLLPLPPRPDSGGEPATGSITVPEPGQGRS